MFSLFQKARQEEKNKLMIDPDILRDAQKMFTEQGAENDEGLFSGDDNMFNEEENTDGIKLQQPRVEELLKKGNLISVATVFNHSPT